MRIEQGERKGVVIVGELRVPGMIWSTPCEVCGGTTVFLPKFDAAFCPACDRWVHEKCGSEGPCPYCLDRPVLPGMYLSTDDVEKRG